jgi:phage terminase large subunit-like protein
MVAVPTDIPPQVQLVQIMEELARRKRENKALYYAPYRKQIDFHAAGAQFRERLLMAGNQLGKTLAASFEVSYHLTGRYPEWWGGKRFDDANHWLAGSESGELTRRGVQRLLIGRDYKTEPGTGSIPRDAIEDITPARGVPDLIDTIKVKHKSGGFSSISLKSYDQGRGKWQADTVSGVWFDEEPPEDVYFEGVTRTNTTLGPIMMTFTPLLGMSNVVKRYLVDKFPGTHVTTMTIHDVEHYTDDQRKAIIASYPPHERKARADGIPTLGSGAVFPVDEDSIKIYPFPIPKHWPRICGLDFGWDHPTAACWLAWDRDTDTIYVYDCYRTRQQPVAIHAAAIKAKGAWIPVAWPHDGNNDTAAGPHLAQQYRDHGLNMLPQHAQFQKERDDTGRSSISVEAGIAEMLDRMQTGRWKVFSHMNDWLEEFRLYHRKDGKLVKESDDAISASRYAMMMLRNAKVEVVKSATISSWNPLDASMGY